MAVSHVYGQSIVTSSTRVTTSIHSRFLFPLPLSLDGMEPSAKPLTRTNHVLIHGELS